VTFRVNLFHKNQIEKDKAIFSIGNELLLLNIVQTTMNYELKTKN